MRQHQRHHAKLPQLRGRVVPRFARCEQPLPRRVLCKRCGQLPRRLEVLRGRREQVHGALEGRVLIKNEADLRDKEIEAGGGCTKPRKLHVGVQQLACTARCPVGDGGPLALPMHSICS